MKASPYVFISYCSKNQQIAELTRLSIANHGLSYWMAPYDIPPGSSYGAEINVALENCSCFVLLLSNASQASVFVQKEVERAVSYGKPIFPVLLEDVALNNAFKFFISDCQFTDVRNFEVNNPNFINLLDTLKCICNGKQTPKIEAPNPDFIIEDGCLKQYVGNASHVTIPNSVTKIGEKAFFCCRSLTSITIPDSVSSIGDSAFNYCESLTSVQIGNGVTSIGRDAFGSCRSLNNVTMGNSVTIIGYEAFYSCKALISITIPDSVTSIGERAFNNCRYLTRVTIGTGVTTIGAYAFSNCLSLTSITFKNTSGWKIGTTNISSTDLQNTTTAANRLTTPTNYTWKRSDS